MDANPVLTITDIMAAGVCPVGIASWCREHDFPYRKIKAGEYRVSDLEAIDDGYAQLVVRYIRAKGVAA